MTSLPRLLTATTCLVVGPSLVASPLLACETVAPASAPPISITAESAVIVWDKEKGVEHFIRRASFDTKNRDFGFIVPTPSRPTLGAADDAIFSDLQAVIAPSSPKSDGWNVSFTPLLASLKGEKEESKTVTRVVKRVAKDSKKGSFQVIENRRIGKYQAAVLSARDSGSLKKWLTANGYSSSPASQKWLEQYVRNGWYLTAFKIAKKNAGETGANLDTVRLTFATPRPFYPYHEPQSARKIKTKGKATTKPRSLRVFFVGDERVVGQIEAPQHPTWPGKMVWSDTLQDDDLKIVGRQLGGSEAPAARLTVFDDSASPRPGVGNLYFSSDLDQSQLRPGSQARSRQRTVLLPLDVLGLGAVAAVVALGRNKRKQGSQL